MQTAIGALPPHVTALVCVPHTVQRPLGYLYCKWVFLIDQGFSCVETHLLFHTGSHIHPNPELTCESGATRM